MYKEVESFFESILNDYHYVGIVEGNIGGYSIQEQIKSSIDFILENNQDVNDEVEKKILEINLDELIIKLEKFGAKKIFDGKIEDSRYDFNNNFLKKQGIFFRTRETRTGDYLTIKKQLDNKNTFEKGCSSDNEFEVELKDIGEVQKNLSNLGLKEIKSKNYIKYRISYSLDGIHFDFDKYDNIPWFLEIESDNEKDVDIWITKLGIGNKKTVKFGYRKLKELYGVNENIVKKAN